MDLLKLVQKIPNHPPFFKEEILDKYGEKAIISRTIFPTPAFASAFLDSRGRRLPQVIAHRGYKAKCPENSLSAFEAAVDAGAHAVETDLHLSKDGVVVLSHDPDLKRCFAIDKKIRDCDWDFIKTLRTTRVPNEPLPCLQDLLELFKKPRWKGVWLMLDIKIDDDPEELMHRLAETFTRVDPGHDGHWKDRVMLGYWTARFIPLCDKYLPGFPITNIGFSPTYCRQFLAVPNAGFNFFQPALISPSGRYFIRAVKAHRRQIYAWTVNDEKNMDWCIRRGVDGIVTDDVAKYFEICDKFNEHTRYGWPMKMLLQFMYFNVWVWVFGIIFSRRYGGRSRPHKCRLA
ncbi:PLC-like phosphodiesterase [Viridothelium virens]|uniref:PLC-like phosphodiesterase n=1 Tax=Viridothelium virens TaxID=1048519 RepID=A0A6A6HBZ3_VIRVR|nr:PLC-like phosphodiesterase [Viridothelium virens]